MPENADARHDHERQALERVLVCALRAVEDKRGLACVLLRLLCVHCAWLLVIGSICCGSGRTLRVRDPCRLARATDAEALPHRDEDGAQERGRDVEEASAPSAQCAPIGIEARTPRGR
jgi:hypothetical protein